MMSINVIGSHLCEHSMDPAKVEKMNARLTAINKSWDETCEAATNWQTKLQTALLEVTFVKRITSLRLQLQEHTFSIFQTECGIPSHNWRTDSLAGRDNCHHSFNGASWSLSVQGHLGIQACQIPPTSRRFAALWAQNCQFTGKNKNARVKESVERDKNVALFYIHHAGGCRSAGTSNGEPAVLWGQEEVVALESKTKNLDQCLPRLFIQTGNHSGQGTPGVRFRRRRWKSRPGRVRKPNHAHTVKWGELIFFPHLILQLSLQLYFNMKFSIQSIHTVLFFITFFKLKSLIVLEVF